MYDYRSVVTFGGWNEDLMIVVNQLIESAPHHYEHRTDKLLFLLPKHKVNKYKNERCKYIHWNGITVKILKFGTPQTITIIVLKIEKFDVTFH